MPTHNSQVDETTCVNSTRTCWGGKKIYWKIPVMFLTSYAISWYSGSYCYILRTSQNGNIQSDESHYTKYVLHEHGTLTLHSNGVRPCTTSSNKKLSIFIC